jgi:transketolase
MAFLGRSNLKLVGSHVGVSPSSDGPSQMALADVAFFHAYAGLRREDGSAFFHLLQPADAYAAYALTVAMARHDGPCYLRTIRPDVAFLYDERTPFPLGGFHALVEGRDLLIASAGLMVHQLLGTLERLRQGGIEPTVVDLYSLPFEEEALVALSRECGGRVLTVEDNYAAGLGSAVAGALAAAGGTFTLRQMYIRKFPKSGRTPEDVLRHVGLSGDDIVKTAQEMMAKVEG